MEQENEDIWRVNIGKDGGGAVEEENKNRFYFSLLHMLTISNLFP